LVEEDDTILAAPDGKNEILKPTALWHRVEALVAEWRPALVVFDPRADLFGGNEISRVQARQFIGMLRRMASQYQATVILADHPSLSGMSSGSGTSGSTAWRNSVRAQLYLQRITVRADKGDPVEPDTDRRVLRSKKANYSKRGAEITLRWRAGVFELDDGSASELAAAPQHALRDLVFIDILERYRRQGREVSATPSANYAPTIFDKDPAAKGLGKPALAGAMNRLLADGRIVIDEFGPPSKRRKRLVVGVAP
jgi:RecA-family ATPase